MSTFRRGPRQARRLPKRKPPPPTTTATTHQEEQEQEQDEDSSKQNLKMPGAKNSNPSTMKSQQSSIKMSKGTKPWTGGMLLSSMGLRDLDVILGAGQPIGTLVVLEEDRWAQDLGLSIVKYWCAEGLAQDQCLFFPTFAEDGTHATMTMDILSSPPTSLACGLSVDNTNHLTRTHGCENITTRADIHRFLESLPRNLHWDRESARLAQTNGNDNDASSNRLALDTLQEDEQEEEESLDDKDDDEGLKIAWQYRKSIQNQRMGNLGARSSSAMSKNARVYCHSYDLSGRLLDQKPNLIQEGPQLYVVNVSDSYHGIPDAANRTRGYRLFSVLVGRIRDIIAKSSPGTVLRLVFFRPPIDETSVALHLLMSHVRRNKLPVIILVLVQPWKNQLANLVALRRLSHVAMQVQGFVGRRVDPPAEYRNLDGLLVFEKIATHLDANAHFADMTNTKCPAALVHGLKRNRRKLCVELLHIPPEDYAASGSSVSGGGVRSGGGQKLGCSSSGGGGSALDF